MAVAKTTPQPSLEERVLKLESWVKIFNENNLPKEHQTLSAVETTAKLKRLIKNQRISKLIERNRTK